MFPPLPNPIQIFSGFVSSAVGWAWDKVVQGVFTWFAEGLLLLIEFVWGLLDTATTPRLTDDWFVNGTVAALVPIALFVTVAMMLTVAIQAALSGRPELALNVFPSAVRAIAGTAYTLIVLDTLIRFADVIADTVWQQARPNTREVLDGIIEGLLGGGGWGATFLGPLALLIGMLSMIVTTVLLFMRSALLYLVAAFAPLVWSSSILPMLRGGVGRLVHIVIGLVLAKPAIVISLAIGMQQIAASPLAGDESGSAVVQVGTLLTGFFGFAVAAVSPWVVYKLLPAAEGAAIGSGIVGGWARSGMNVAQAAMMAKSMGASRAVAAATKAVPTGAAGGTGSSGFSAPTGGPDGPAGGGGPTSGGGGQPSGGAMTTGAAGSEGAPGAAGRPGATSTGVATAAAASGGEAGSSGSGAAGSSARSAGSAPGSGWRSSTAAADRGEVSSTSRARRVVVASRARREEGGDE